MAASATATLVLVNLASIMEKADEALLPGAYREIGLALHASPSLLGSLTLLRSLVQAACFPIAAYVSHHHDRATVIAAGALLWSFATILVGISSSFLQVAISRALNGIGLAIVIPAIQSIVADSTSDVDRGSAFGWLQLTGNIGSSVGGLCAVLLSGEVIFGIAGWRIAFLIVAVVSVVVGVLVYLFALDPRRFWTHDTRMRSGKTFSLCLNTKEMFLEAKAVMQVRTFQVIIAQGVAGSFPWAALAFAAMWLETIGYTHEVTAFLLGLFIASGSLGALIGGYLGDYMAKHFPNWGRIILAQISSGVAVPLVAVLLLGLPADPSVAVLHGAILTIMGLCITWNAPATNNPIFAEIVPKKSRATVYALDRSFEAVLASFAPPIVGLLAQKVFGYVTVSKPNSAQGSLDRGNARALAKALYAAVGAPMAICCAVYTFLYWTYPKDRANAILASEYEGLQVDPEAAVELSTQLQHNVQGQINGISYSDEIVPKNLQESAHLLSGR